MSEVNKNYLNLKPTIFPEIAKKLQEFKLKNPSAQIINLSVGDVSRPLPEVSVKAIRKAADEMLDIKTFRGYGPEEGYPFLRNAVIENEYKPLGINFNEDEVFINDGAIGDIADTQDLFAADAVVLLPEPAYSAPSDTNIIAGRKIYKIPFTAENNFSPRPPDNLKADIIYLTNPHNPTGTAMNTQALKYWIDYAKENKAVIIYDAAYKDYVQSPGIPKSVYQVDGAKEVVIEVCSYSKTAGFTGLRCGYTIIPKEIYGSVGGNQISLNRLWYKHQTAKSNGTSYIMQRAAEAIYTPRGQAEVRKIINHYMENASILRESLRGVSFEIFGGIDAPYIWLKLPEGLKSEDFFDIMLEKINVACIPGTGFGVGGEGYFRLSAFGARDITLEAARRIKNFKL